MPITIDHDAIERAFNEEMEAVFAREAQGLPGYEDPVSVLRWIQKRLRETTVDPDFADPRELEQVENYLRTYIPRLESQEPWEDRK